MTRPGKSLPPTRGPVRAQGVPQPARTQEAHIIIPLSLRKAYAQINKGCAWVAVLTDDEGAWVYSSQAKMDDVADDLAKLDTHSLRMEYLIAGLLEMEETAVEVDLDDH